MSIDGFCFFILLLFLLYVWAARMFFFFQGWKAGSARIVSGAENLLTDLGISYLRIFLQIASEFWFSIETQIVP
jgi:hypothetical protein